MEEQRHIRQEDDEINLLDYLLVLLKRKKFIVVVTLFITVATAIVSLIIPKVYRAESKILLPPSQNQSLSSQILGQLSGVTRLNLGAAAGIKTPNDLYIGLLKSRPVLDGVIDKLRLKEIRKTESQEEARQRLLGQLNAEDNRKTGIITIRIEDGDPKRAADLANAFIEELRIFNRTLAVTEASQRRLFYEEQLKETRGTLLDAEESMKGFQEKTGAIKIDEQARAAIQGIAQLRAQIAAKEVQLKVAQSYATKRNPDVQRIEEEVKGLKEQLGRLEGKGGRGDPLMSTSRMPQVGTDYVRKMRELRFNEALYEILLKQFEVAKLDEARDTTVIQVIEKAMPPETRFKPERTRMVIIAFIVGFFIAVFGALLLEFLDRLKQNPGNRQRLEQIKRSAMGGWGR